MSEGIVEMILPGTYIDVRAEGLLSVGTIATGNIGIIGTAERGTTEIQMLSSFEEARARFGEPGAWDTHSPDTSLTLVRSHDSGERNPPSGSSSDLPRRDSGAHAGSAEAPAPRVPLHARQVDRAHGRGQAHAATRVDQGRVAPGLSLSPSP